MKQVAFYIFFAVSTIALSTLLLVNLAWQGTVQKFGVPVLLFILGSVFILYIDDLLGDRERGSRLAREVFLGGGFLAFFFAAFDVAYKFLV